MGKFSRQKGDRRERDLIHILEHIGCHVTRSSGSLGMWDMISVDDRLISFIQASSNAWKSPAERKALLNFKAPESKIVALVMVRTDDPKYKTIDGKRKMTKPAAIYVMMATTIDRRWKRMRYLEDSFMAVRKEINYDGRKKPEPVD